MTLSSIVPNSRSLIRAVLVIVIGTLLNLGTMPLFAEDSPQCSTSAASREFDYWLGDWTVTYPGASSSATSTVSLELDKCLLVESWIGGKGHSGKNMFAYSPDDKNWHGMFADNEGRVHVLEGNVLSGSAEFRGSSRGANGETVLNRIRVVRLTPDKVEQIWQKSTDKGVTWTTVFHGEYSRRKS